MRIGEMAVSSRLEADATANWFFDLQQKSKFCDVIARKQRG